MDEEKLLVISDTHGNIPALKAVLKWAQARVPPNGTIGTAVFLGDGATDLRPAITATGFSCDWKLVKGNNDWSFSIPETAVFDFCSHRFFICHGHRYSLYNGYQALADTARNAEADAVLFGHLHVPVFKREKDLLLVNPGSVGSPRSRIGSSFAVIECIEKQPLKVEFWGIGTQGEIRELKIREDI